MHRVVISVSKIYTNRMNCESESTRTSSQNDSESKNNHKIMSAIALIILRWLEIIDERSISRWTNFSTAGSAASISVATAVQRFRK